MSAYPDPPQTTVQAGLGVARYWLLEYPRETPPSPDPLMGWASAGGTGRQSQFRFRSLADAVRYAEEVP